MGERVTIVDIARQLGLSTATVSNALNGTGRIGQSTRDRVRAEAERVGYVTSRAARSLRTGRFGAVGLHLPSNLRGLPFYMDFALGLTDSVADAELDVLLITGAEERLAKRPPAVDIAVVVDPFGDSRVMRALQEHGLPLVSAGRALDPMVKPKITVEAPYRELMTQIVERLASHGVTQPVMMSVRESFPSAWAIDTHEGFLRACEAFGLDPHIAPVAVDATATEIVAATAAAVAQHHPDALVLGAQRHAGIVRSRMGMGDTNSVVPHIISCAGDPTTELSDPHVTSIDPQPTLFGQRCGEAVKTLLTSKGLEERWEIHPATIRWSSALLADGAAASPQRSKRPHTSRSR